jgi:hypothetical protein
MLLEGEKRSTGLGEYTARSDGGVFVVASSLGVTDEESARFISPEKGRVVVGARGKVDLAFVAVGLASFDCSCVGVLGKLVLWPVTVEMRCGWW